MPPTGIGRPSFQASLLCAVAASLLTGCAVGTAYQPPPATLPGAWQAPMPPQASPAPVDAPWAGFDDPAVAALVDQAQRNSPTLDRAAAQIAAARALLSAQEASALPTVTGRASLTRSRGGNPQNPSLIANTRSAGFDASWEIDLFGKQRQAREAASARMAARGDDWYAARVSLAAEVADNYVQYRACRLLQASYAEQAASLRETERITAAAVGAGFNPAADDDLAQASAATARAQVVAQQTACEVLVKALVALSGLPEPELRPLIDSARTDLPTPANLAVTRVPADLLRLRPDLAAAERTLAAAHADINQAEANRYPSFSLSGSITVAAVGAASALTSGAFGPSLSLPLFDGGRRRAAVASAQAAYDTALADYRASLRTAVSEVEQALTQLDGIHRRSDDAALAAARYQRYFEASERHWRAGGISLLLLEEARRSAASARTTLINLRSDQLRRYIALYKALGGGWRGDAPLALNTSSKARP